MNSHTDTIANAFQTNNLISEVTKLVNYCRGQGHSAVANNNRTTEEFGSSLPIVSLPMLDIAALEELKYPTAEDKYCTFWRPQTHCVNFQTSMTQVCSVSLF